MPPRNKYKLSGRKEQIAIELGLIPAPASNTTPVVRHGRIPYPKQNNSLPVQVEEQVTRKCIDCPGGRHRVIDGWCVDGRIWTHAEVHTMKKIKALAGEEMMNRFMTPAILAFKDTLGLEFVEAHVSVVP